MRILVSCLLLTIFNPVYSQYFKLGLIADCQYCNCEYSTKWNNNYSQSPYRLQQAVDTFKLHSLDAVFHLGDFIDRDEKSFDTLLPILNQLLVPKYHLLGNHDYSVSPQFKKRVPTTLGLTDTYYSVELENWTIIALDGTDISTYNSNDSMIIAKADSVRRFYFKKGRSQAQPWNGAISSTQLKWLDNQLAVADKTKRNVAVFCHFPIYPSGDSNLWNDVEVISILEKHISVKAYINGHHHSGNYKVKNGIHYLTLKGMVQTKTENSFSIGSFYDSEILLEGFGREADRVLKF